MSPTEHVIYGAAASSIVAPYIGTPASISFFAGSVLIDLDHYLDYLYFGRFKNWTIRGMFLFHGKMARSHHQKDLMALEAFHTAEFLFAFLAVGVYFKSTLLISIFAGMIFHMGLDLVRLHAWGSISIRALSFVEYVFRAREMRRRGVDPEAPFWRAYQEAFAITAAHPAQNRVHLQYQKDFV